MMGRKMTEDGGVEEEFVMRGCQEPSGHEGALARWPDAFCVNFESVWGPTTDVLKCIVWNASKSEGRGTSWTEPMATDSCTKVGLEMRDKPCSCWGEASRGEPEFQMKRKKWIAGGYVVMHGGDRVQKRAV
jgi:hypothetical protein